MSQECGVGHEMGAPRAVNIQPPVETLPLPLSYYVSSYLAGLLLGPGLIGVRVAICGWRWGGDLAKMREPEVRTCYLTWSWKATVSGGAGEQLPSRGLQGWM